MYVFTCQSNLIIFYLVEYTIVCLILAGCSRTWNHLKNIQGDSRDGQRFIRRQLTAVPEIRMKIECYHYKENSSTDSRGNRTSSNDRSVSFTKTELMPYTTWWIEGDLSHSETLMETYRGKFTFVSLDYEVSEANEFTKNAIKSWKLRVYDTHKWRDSHCDVTVEFFAQTGASKFSLKKDDMEIPWYCKPLNFWLVSFLPLPFFNGALIRWYVNNTLSVEERRSIVRYVEIREGCEEVNHVKPASDSDRGFQQSIVENFVENMDEVGLVECYDDESFGSQTGLLDGFDEKKSGKKRSKKHKSERKVQQTSWDNDFEVVEHTDNWENMSSNRTELEPSAPPPNFDDVSVQDENIPPPYNS